jgi:hypothetical protein
MEVPAIRIHQSDLKTWLVLDTKMDLPYSVYSLCLDNQFTGPNGYSCVYTSWIGWLEKQVWEVETRANTPNLVRGDTDQPVEPPENLWTATHDTGR